jgi:peptidyl-prolyl cis-trans isomerase D
MLDLFRQRGLSNVIYGAVIVATILAFVITFRPNAQQRTASLSETCVAKVRGRCITPKDFQASYRVLLPQGGQSAARRMNLKRVAIDGLIERELLGDDAKRLGIGVTDAEVTDQLYAGYVRVSVPAADPHLAASIQFQLFQQYGRSGLVPQDVAQAHFSDGDTAIPVDFRDPKTKLFDMKVYERVVRNLSNRSTAEFREEQSRELLAAKVRDVVREPIRVSESEAWQEYDRQHSTAIVTWIPVKESWAARWAVDVKQADVDAWIKDHQADFDKTLEQRKSEDAPKAGHIRHILVKLPYGASDEEKAVALAKLSSAVARIKAGESFAEVARDTSDDPGSASKGGDVGDKTDAFVPPFKAAADALKPGESTAGAVETQFGYHYIAKDDPAKAADVEAQVKRSVARSMVAKAKATDVAQVVAKRIDDAMHAGKSAEDAIKEAIAPYVHETKVVAALKVLQAPGSPGAGDAGAAESAAKAAPGGAKAAAGAAKTAAASNAAAGTAADRRFDASTDGDRPQPQTSTAFNRGGDPFPGLTPDGTEQVVAFAFAGKEGEAMAAPLRMTDGFAVVQLKQHKGATRDEFAKDRETFEEGLLRTKRDEALSLYVTRLRDQAKNDIKVEESFVQEAKVDGGSSANEDEDEY